MTTARYDGLAEWYDQELGPFVERSLPDVRELLGPGSGRCLDVACGTGIASLAVAELGWNVAGVDVSADQLRIARTRLGSEAELVEADATALPFPDRSFDAAVSTFTHTDLDEFAAAVQEVARVLRPGAPFVYLGLHPCFVGPHSSFVHAEGIPELHAGYFESRRYFEAPGIVNPEGLRARVGALHLPLGKLVQAFLDAGLRLERLEERGGDEYPAVLAFRWRKP
ncbi:MAG: hypothetical protein QOE36_3069 [Gaiellaceae bacterium]|jgi:SAM-dependent methyltransferase|nr:hypothetical protein [Gaiellaceae bacterium]